MWKLRLFFERKTDESWRRFESASVTSNLESATTACSPSYVMMHLGKCIILILFLFLWLVNMFSTMLDDEWRHIGRLEMYWRGMWRGEAPLPPSGGGGRNVGVHGIVYSVYVYVCKRLQGIRCMRIPVYWNGFHVPWLQVLGLKIPAACTSSIACSYDRNQCQFCICLRKNTIICCYTPW